MTTKANIGVVSMKSGLNTRKKYEYTKTQVKTVL